MTGRRWLLAGIAALAGLSALGPVTVPIYDGIGNPDEPYRYVKPPPNAATTKAPTSAQAVIPIRNGQSAAEYANTAENGPQLSLYLPTGTLQAPGGVTAVTVTATPMAPSPPLPTDGTIVTDVYHITATAGSQSIPVVGTGRRAPVLQMRAPDARQPGPVFEHRTGNGWQRTQTLRVAFDVYQTSVPALGDWALVRLSSPASPGSNSGGGGVNWALLGGGLALLLLAGAIVAIRVRRTASARS